MVMAVASRYLPGEVEDAFQEVMIRLAGRSWLALRRWEQRAPLAGYVARITRNWCTDRLRHSTGNPVRTDGEPLDPPDQDINRNPEALYFAREIRECIEKAINALSETHRRLINLRHVENLKHPEIAQRLGKTLGYVGPTLARAEQYLRDELREICPEHLGAFADATARRFGTGER
jgi:RNA polymerase sigma-70 factor (ECF subfamily)